MNNTPQSNRLHITLLGKRNSGKSSLINALTGQEAALVSDIPGTTTDLVYKAMEIKGIGPCVFIDTPGFDDTGELGEKRIEQTLKAIDKTDIALLLCDPDMAEEQKKWIQLLDEKCVPFILLLNKIDIRENTQQINDLVISIKKQYDKTMLQVSAAQKQGIDLILQSIIQNMPGDYKKPSITGDRVKAGDLVLLVIPQDIQAPEGRLILPQVQTLRELLDKKCIVMSCTTDQLQITLQALSFPPRLIIADSQVFKTVYELKPEESKLTSFSILFAGYKGDINYFKESVKTIDQLKETSRVLIAEACTHAPQTEDIGRVKIPRLLRNKIGEGLSIDIVSGNDFPENLTSYDLIIHCGACMFNRKHVLTRVEQAKKQEVPMSNYGVVLAYLSGVLEKIDW